MRRAPGENPSRAPSIPAALAVGTTFAHRYRIDAALGEGGVALVFRVADASRGRRLALKYLSASASPRLLSLFELEYQTLAGLRHPHMIEVYEYGRDEAGLYYTMELLEGQDLRSLAPMPWRDVCAALRDAALALGVLHARRLVHRDPSPRNLWRLPDGRVKLLDFGALASFGAADSVVGTPPLVSPEALDGDVLDQRADLYALGATAYYLLAGRHAFPARELRELPLLWQVPCLPPSAADVAIPPELDALVLSLLHVNPLARPSSTAELIDRIDSVLGDAAEPRAYSPRLHLDNPAFVERTRERRRLRRLLRLAARGRRQSVLIEAEPGMGRTRLLHELAVEARVAQGVVLQVDAAGHSAVHGGAAALAHKLLDALPAQARRAAEPQRRALAHVSPELRERLGLAAEAPPDVPGVLRLMVQNALCAWFSRVAADHFLVLLVDGLEHADDGTSAFLLALARAQANARLLIVGSSTAVSSVALRALAGASRRVHVPPLTEAGTLELLRSVFGPAVHLSRLAAHLHRIAHGNPGHVLELAAQLVAAQVIGFSEGVWVLPQEVPEARLPRSREQVLAKRLTRASADALALARMLSVWPGTLDFALACALSERDARELAPLLDELCELDIMTRGDEGLRFAHEQFRSALLAELEPSARSRAQRALGEQLLARAGLGALERLQAGLQLLESGDAEAASIVIRATTHITLREPDQLTQAAPLVERAVALLRERARPERELFGLLCPLAIAGYFVDRRYAVHYGESAVAALREVLGLKLARQLRRFLGGALGLMAAIVYSSARYLFRRSEPALADALVLQFMTATALSASSGLCYDYALTSWAAEVLSPFAALGRSNAASFSYHVSRGLADGTRDALGATCARWERYTALLESTQRIWGLPDNLRVRYLTGLLFSLGMMGSQRDDPRTLEIAERLDHMGAALYPMNTDQLRAIHYGHQGNAKLYRHYRELSEQRAIQQGAIWQNETWALLVESIVSHRHHDVMAMKRVAEQLRNACKIVPSLSVYADRARGTYLLLREQYSEALPWLERCLSEPLRENFAWGRSHGVLARAYNALGRYADARAACARVLNEFTPADLEFPGLTLLIEAEALVADAGLGDIDRASNGVHRLLGMHAPNAGPLTIGELHETGVRIALISRDEAAARAHAAHMQRWYESTAIPSLVQYCEAVRTRVQAAFAGAFAANSSEPLAFLTAPITRDRTLERFERGLLSAVAEQVGCKQAFLYLVASDGALHLEATFGAHAIDAAAVAWLEDRVASDSHDVVTKVIDQAIAQIAAPDVLAVNDWRYRAHYLYSTDATHPAVTAAVVLAGEQSVPALIPAPLLQLMAERLRQMRDAGFTGLSTTQSG